MLGVDVSTVMEGVVRRELTVSFEAQDVSKQRADGCVDVADSDEKRMQKDRVEFDAPLMCCLMCCLMRNLASSAINDVCSSACAKGALFGVEEKPAGHTRFNTVKLAQEHKNSRRWSRSRHVFQKMKMGNRRIRPRSGRRSGAPKASEP